MLLLMIKKVMQYPRFRYILLHRCIRIIYNYIFIPDCNISVYLNATTKMYGLYVLLVLDYTLI